MKTNKQTKKIIELIRNNPKLTNKQIVDKYELECHPNNLSNIRRRYNLPKSIRGYTSRKNQFQDIRKNHGNIRTIKYESIPGLDNIKPYTKWRFIAELLGYSGTSLTLRGYKLWIKKQI